MTTIQQDVPMNFETTYTNKAAGFWIRFFAYIVDLLLIAAVLNGFIIHTIFDFTSLKNVQLGFISLETCVSGIVFYLYFTLMTKFFGQTLGKMIFGIRVICEKQATLSWGTVFFREWIGRFISVTIKILYIVPAFTPQKRAIHDYIADTRVIHENSYEQKEVLKEVIAQQPINLENNHSEQLQQDDKL